jgi:hypothetical protein
MLTQQTTVTRFFEHLNPLAHSFLNKQECYGIAPDRKTCNQIDHVPVNQNKSSMIQDVRTLRKLNCDSDHFLMKVMIIRTLIRTQQNNNAQRKQWNRKNLQNKEKLKQYRQSCIIN